MPEHHPLPTPVRSIYGFCLYIGSYIFIGFYFLWAYIPDELLNQAGLVNLPNKFWAIALPAFVWITFIILQAIIFTVNLIYSFYLTDEIKSYGPIRARQPLNSSEFYIPPIEEIDLPKKSTKTACLVQLLSLD